MKGERTATERGSRSAALARAHALTLPVTSEGGRRVEQSTTLHALIQTILSPYEGRTDGDRARVAISGTGAGTRAPTAGDVGGWQASRAVDDVARFDPDDPFAL